MKKNLFPVVIIAGGLATRLRPLTESIPKSLLEIHGEPFVAHQLRLLHHKGVREVVMCLGYLGERIMDYVGDGSRFGLKVSYLRDGNTLLGTAGAIKRALPFLPEVFFVLNGDSYLLCDYHAVQKAFFNSGKPALMTIFYNQCRWDTSNVECVEGHILTYDKVHRTPRMLHIDYGLEVFTQSALAHVPDNEPYDLAAVYQRLLEDKQLAMHEVFSRFYENGSLVGIKELESYLSSKEMSWISSRSF